jgi:hypothetical protein
MEQIGGGILVKAVHEGIMSSVVLPGRVESVRHVAMSSRLVVPVLLLGGRIVQVSVRGGMSNSADLREVKPVWTGEMSSSVIGPILLSGRNIESASLGLRSGIEVGFGIGAQLQVLNLARCCPEIFMPCPIFADPAWKAGPEPTRHQLLDCRICIHGIGGERHKESGKCNAKVVRVRMVDTESAGVGEACAQRLGLLVFY